MKTHLVIAIIWRRLPSSHTAPEPEVQIHNQQKEEGREIKKKIEAIVEVLL